MTHTDDSALTYATPTPGGANRHLWIGAILIAGGLGLVALGGCFLIGVMLVLRNGFLTNAAAGAPMTGHDTAFLVVLYTCAAVTFAGAATLIVMAVRTLFRGGR